MNEIQNAMLEEKNEERALCLIQSENRTEMEYYWIMIWSGMFNCWKILNYTLTKEFPTHTDVYVMTVCEAAKHGHMDMIMFLLDRVDKDSYSKIMSYAALSGHIEIVEFFLDLMKDESNVDYNTSMRIAASAKENSSIIVQLMIDKGANNYAETAVNAASYCNNDVVNMMLDKGANNYDEIMHEAALRGNIEMFLLMLGKGATSFNSSLSAAANRGHMEIVEILLEKATNYAEAASNVYLGDGNQNRQSIVELLNVYKGGKGKIS